MLRVENDAQYPHLRIIVTTQSDMGRIDATSVYLHASADEDEVRFKYCAYTRASDLRVCDGDFAQGNEFADSSRYESPKRIHWSWIVHVINSLAVSFVIVRMRNRERARDKGEGATGG